ncbi:hypothetical protein EDB83DRAFT_2515324 [Lactarius deliciosus]|nr:hypothetical protein EDB83DRAFT_2515324 [Lactarius deliciosus]
MSSSEHIPPPAPQWVIPLSSGPPLTSSSSDRPAVKGRAKSNQSHPVDVDLSVFDILNIFRRRWFLSRANLLANAISAQKAEDGNISWVEFSPPFHSHLVKCAVALVPHPLHVVKKVMFVYILELLNREGHLAFFKLQKGGRKANNAQKEKWCLARKRSRASKQERDREAAKAAQLPPRERECLTCGCKFKSRKTAKKHKCARHSKVVREKEAGASGSSSHPAPLAQLNRPAPPLTPLAPTAPTHSSAAPPVTRDLEVPPFSSYPYLIPAMTDLLNMTPMPPTFATAEDWMYFRMSRKKPVHSPDLKPVHTTMCHPNLTEGNTQHIMKL